VIAGVRQHAPSIAIPVAPEQAEVSSSRTHRRCCAESQSQGLSICEKCLVPSCNRDAIVALCLALVNR
jgi:hypothetical protein